MKVSQTSNGSPGLLNTLNRFEAVTAYSSAHVRSFGLSRLNAVLLHLEMILQEQAYDQLQITQHCEKKTVALKDPPTSAYTDMANLLSNPFSIALPSAVVQL